MRQSLAFSPGAHRWPVITLGDNNCFQSCSKSKGRVTEGGAGSQRLCVLPWPFLHVTMEQLSPNLK